MPSLQIKQCVVCLQPINKEHKRKYSRWKLFWRRIFYNTSQGPCMTRDEYEHWFLGYNIEEKTLEREKEFAVEDANRIINNQLERG